MPNTDHRINRRDFLRGLGISIISGGVLANTILTGCKANPTTTEPGSDAFASIGTDELAERLTDSGWVVLDTRPKASFNGWKLFGEVRGGHIEGALSFPVAWTLNAADGDLRQKIEAQGITSDKKIVIYHPNAAERKLVAARLETLGYANLYLYNDFLTWAADNDLPVKALPNYHKLVHAGWVNDLVTGKGPATYQGNKYVILEVSWGPPDDYEKGHIPGALHLDTDEIESLPVWKFRSDEQLTAVWKELGITSDTLVVVYSTDASPAARALIALMRAGVKDVRLLDGGWSAWLAGGYQAETATNQRVPVSDFGAAIPVHPEYILDIGQVKALSQQPDFELVAIRRWEEFIGEISGYSYIKPKGSIPGSVWGHNNRDLRDQDGKMLDFNRISELWQEWGITPDKKVAFYCGTGWRASEAWFYAHLMGWSDVALYDSGWMDWSIDPANPIQVGDPRTNGS